MIMGTFQEFRDASRAKMTLLGLALLALAVASSQAGAPVYAGDCPTSGTCTTDSDCVPIATSLRPANGPTDDVGWDADGSACGVNKNTGDTCGATLGDSVCGADPTGPDCNPTEDPACCAPDDLECILNQLNSVSLRQPPTAVRTLGFPEFTGERFQQAAEVALPVAVDRLLTGLATVHSVYMKARIQVSRPAAQRNDSTTYEYWESDNRYRIHTDIDPRLGLQDIPDLAFDGRHHQMLLRSHLRTVLSLSGKDSRRAYLGIPNPLFLPLLFFTPEDQDRCVLCDLRLADLRQIAARRGARRTATSPKLSLPGGRIFNRPTSFGVTLDEAGRVAEIRRVTPEGISVVSVRLSHYMPEGGGKFVFPRRIDWSRNDAAGKSLTTLRVAIDELQIDRPVDASVFTLSFGVAEKVFDSDTDRWLKVSPNAPTCIK